MLLSCPRLDTFDGYSFTVHLQNFFQGVFIAFFKIINASTCQKNVTEVQNTSMYELDL